MFTVDIDKAFEPDLCIDIMDLTPEIILEKFGRPDIIWASPPCTTFSIASVYRYWDKGKPKNEKTLQGIAIVKKTLELIKQLDPLFWIIENPRGMLRKQEFMPNNFRNTVSYCQYGANIMKPTDLWNNILGFIPRICKPGAACHERASRGSKKGVQGLYNPSWDKSLHRNKRLRAIVPKQLCEEIIKCCEGYNGTI